jgi:Nif-specific regulatory protein
MADIIFTSHEMSTTLRTAKAVARTSSPVLIEGESGTGKELIARLIHEWSDRRDAPFVAINCGAIPEALFESEVFGYRAGAFTGAVRDKPGIFEAANGGTLFLDEVGDLHRSLQAKCLRVLQEQEFRRVGDVRLQRLDVRLLSATNKDLEREMKRDRFREDLFFRIGVLRVRIEPLRNRTDDIPLLCRHFAEKYARDLGRPAPVLDKDLLDLLAQYQWPGNVRELENEIHRLVALASDHQPIGSDRLSARILEAVRAPGAAGRGRLKSRLVSYERQIIKEALERYGWNKTRVARHLGLTRQGLHRKLRRYGIDRGE